ncbi:MAG TPA: hypothetical protein VGL74_00085 [Terriglobales bacterium]
MKRPTPLAIGLSVEGPFFFDAFVLGELLLQIFLGGGSPSQRCHWTFEPSSAHGANPFNRRLANPFSDSQNAFRRHGGFAATSGTGAGNGQK